MRASGRTSDLEQLTDGAALLSRAGNRVAALAVLWAAVAIGPTDQIAHRRLAATLANAGDLDAAAQEYVRYLEFLLPLGELTRVTTELHYAATTLGALPAVGQATRQVAASLPALLAQQRAITAASGGLAAAGRFIDRVGPKEPDAIAAPVAGQQTLVPFPSSRAGVRIALNVCLHEDAETDWIQLEGGTAELRPSQVRLLEGDTVVETRRCLATPPGGTGHAQPSGTEPGAVWAVIAAPPAMRRDGDRYRVEAKVGDEWLETELTDTGCRFGRRSGGDPAARSA
ncbi:MAG TPA: hypothetical protein VIN34_05820 [Candidatus Limnocylindria bacterium]|jgi:hypothetical protein